MRSQHREIAKKEHFLKLKRYDFSYDKPKISSYHVDILGFANVENRLRSAVTRRDAIDLTVRNDIRNVKLNKAGMIEKDQFLKIFQAVGIHTK